MSARIKTIALWVLMLPALALVALASSLRGNGSVRGADAPEDDL